ncbi:OmpH family outer membrane protein [Pedobacter sp. Du54]|uniref:OmpH family outer membrane protein n=1 Tax=Pedobacter anseongensis TaxID=3133439 RepID=UPI0030983BA4
MRKLINVFFVAAGLMLTANIANAQQKFGHLNTDEIYDVMPEAKAAQSTLEALNKVKQTEIENMIKEYQVKLKAAQDKEAKGQKLQTEMSEANKVATMKELDVISKELQQASIDLQDFQKRIDDAKTKATNDLTAKQQELFPQVSRKVSTAIAAVAKEKGLAYVFDISAQSGFNNVVYFDGGENVTDAVKTKLGISLTATPAAAVKTPATTSTKKN